MGSLYFRAHGQNMYPHPRTRLLSLTLKLKAAHPALADRLDRIAYHCHAFFDNVWAFVASHHLAQDARPSPTWRGVEELHRKAHTASESPPL